jgi:Na+-driven multidrug efflux pump
MALLSAMINVVLCLWLIPLMGAAGGAVATSVAYVVSMATMIGLFLRHSGLHVSAIFQVDLRGLLHTLRRSVVRSADDGAQPPAGGAPR